MPPKQQPLLDIAVIAEAGAYTYSMAPMRDTADRSLIALHATSFARDAARLSGPVYQCVLPRELKLAVDHHAVHAED